MHEVSKWHANVDALGILEHEKPVLYSSDVKFSDSGISPLYVFKSPSDTLKPRNRLFPGMRDGYHSPALGPWRVLQ